MNVRRALRWLVPTTLLALAPKCLLCLLAYAGAGAAFGLGGPEICGASAGFSVAWTSPLAWMGVGAALGAVGWLTIRSRKDHRQNPACVAVIGAPLDAGAPAIESH